MQLNSNFDKALFRLTLILFAVGLGVIFLVYFSGLLKPFVTAAIIWYLIKALYTSTGRITIIGRRAPKWLRKIIPLIIVFFALELTIDMIISSLSGIITNYQQYQKTFDTFLGNFGDSLNLGNITSRLRGQVDNLNLPQLLRDTLSSFSSTLGSVVIVIVYVVFLLLEDATFSKKIDALFASRPHRQRVHSIIDAINESTNKYITLKTYVSLLVGFLSYVVLLLFGIQYAFLWAFLIFLFNYIPYIGSLLATLLPALFAVLQFGSLWPLLWVMLSIGSLQLIIGNYVEPKMMGRSLNLSPLVVVLALSFWGAMWGLLGMVLAVPLTSVMLIVLAQFSSTRGFAVLLTENGDITGIRIKKNQKKEPSKAEVD